MLSLNLAADDWATYLHGLNLTYDMKTVVQLTDLEHNVVSDISHLLMDGNVDAEEVTGDADGGGEDGSSSVAVQATCSLTLCDPSWSLGLDSRSPADAAIYLDRMVKVVVSTKMPGLGWVDCPVFCGPVSKFDRDGVTASVEAQSKEWLLLDPADKSDKYKGDKVDAIRKMLTDFGEDPARIDLPPSSEPVPETVQFTRETLPWNRIWYLGRTMAATPFYDGRGVLRFMPETQAPVATVRGDAVTSTIQIGYDTDDLRNGVHVRGKKSSIDASRYLPASNPNSRQLLGRRGKLRSRVERIEDSAIRSDKSAAKMAQRELDRRGATIVRPAFECHPIWPLEIGDTLALDLPEFTGSMRVTSWRKPLTVNDQMTLGYLLPVLSPSTSIRRP